jgi:hypothetical protein
VIVDESRSEGRSKKEHRRNSGCFIIECCDFMKEEFKEIEW